MKILVTGGCGFVGSAVVRALEQRGDEVVVIDNLSYSAMASNLTPKTNFVNGDVRNFHDVSYALKDVVGLVDGVIHCAAQTHVDRSIAEGIAFADTNVVGTAVMLDQCQRLNIPRFVHVSTDEVYGQLSAGGAPFTESSSLSPRSPYAASKAAADLMVLAHYETHGYPACITRCGNNVGPRQFPEKLVPLAITNLLRDRPVPLYNNGWNIRDWIHVEDHAEALLLVLDKGHAGTVYNVGLGIKAPDTTWGELTNRVVIRQVLDELNREWNDSTIVDVPDRKGHDYRYALNSGRLNQLGWKPRWTALAAIRDAVRWYINNVEWWKTALARMKP